MATFVSKIAILDVEKFVGDQRWTLREVVEGEGSHDGKLMADDV